MSVTCRGRSLLGKCSFSLLVYPNSCMYRHDIKSVCEKCSCYGLINGLGQLYNEWPLYLNTLIPYHTLKFLCRKNNNHQFVNY